MTREQCLRLYADVHKDNDTPAMHNLCLNDLFYLLLIACKRKDMNDEWLYQRVREVEANPDDNLDLWSREHYKSTIITYGLTIQDILKDPEITCSIFSHTRPIAKAFLSQIKNEFELNTFLQDLFPNVLYRNPQKESPKWSLDDGIVVKRKSNPKESTIEAWGLVDGQPTSKHFKLNVYDDVVSKEAVSTPEMIMKTTDAWRMSLNLGAKDGKSRYIGTRWHANDTYKVLIDQKTARPRIYPATDDGTFAGKPVFFTQQLFDKKCADMGSYVAAAQLLQNPLADNAMGFKDDWLQSYGALNPMVPMNYYLLCDPASKKKTTNDYTVMVIIGLSADNNVYLVDGIRDRLNLTERTKKIFELHRKWKPRGVGYEEYGMQADIEHIKYVQEQDGYRFFIQPLGGSMAKVDRIKRLVPIFEQRRFYLPYRMVFTTVAGKVTDFVAEFLRDEYSTFPLSKHDDMLDCISRYLDDDLHVAQPKPLDKNVPQEYANKAGQEFCQGTNHDPLNG